MATKQVNYPTCAEIYSQEALALYYEKLFPVNLIYKWLRYDNNLNMEKREISFELPRNRFLRNRSFENEDELHRYLLKKVPIKIDIGAIFNVSPRDYVFTNASKAIEKELVFDIDMTDYNDVRTCCDEANVCKKCWKFLCVACKILEGVLNKDFGFEHILFVYSGRRGIHCWVCDEHARKLSDYERSCILSYMNIIQGGIYTSRRVHLNGDKIHSSIKRALDIISKYFKECIIKEQNILGTEDGIKKFLNVVWDAPKNFEDALRKAQTSEERWQAFQLCISNLKQNNSLPKHFRYIEEEIMLHYMYPRFDCNVTRKKEHLLKSPFSVHPKTRRISIPFSAKKVDSFDLDNVPTLDLVLGELNKKFGQFKKENKTIFVKVNVPERNVTFTSLLEPYNYFQRFIKTLEQSFQRKVQREDIYSW